MNKTAFLFPGQGSQTVGMAKDIYEEFDYVRELFDMAEDTVKIHLSRLCFSGPMSDLTQTVNLQPAITVASLAFLLVLEKEGIFPNVSAGHSLGEYGALCSAGVLTKQDAIALVHARGKLMHRESLKNEGTMRAIIGLEIGELQKIVDSIAKDEIVSTANHNAKQQIVISGVPSGVEKVSALASEKGAKAIALKVSGAWHSPLMKKAEEDFVKFLDDTTFFSPKTLIVHNYTSDYSPDDISEIKKIMALQICNPVRWYESLLRLFDSGVQQFVEIGPGKVLTGLVKKSLPKQHNALLFSINDLKSLEIFFKNVR